MNIDRYTCNTTVTVTRDPMRMSDAVKGISVMEKAMEGEWVSWFDFEKMRKELEARIPELQIKRAYSLLLNGQCPECEQRVIGYSAPSGSFAPEAYATMREQGINTQNGHRNGCSLQNT